MTVAEPVPAMLVRLPGRALTLADVAELAAVDELHRYELDEGNLLVMPPADAEHAEVITSLIVWLVNGGYAREHVLATPGLRINQSSGRSPDLLVLRRRAASGTVWIDPDDVLLAVEVVSRSSERLDRVVKPRDYARVGIGQYWRVERAGGQATVHMYTLGAGEQGEPVYVGHRAVLLEELLAGTVPALA
jgi:Uma2 family endonuclease